MSIAILIVPKDGALENGRLVPVATQDVFRAHWSPAACALNLRWVPLFETGIVLEREDLADVIRELHQLRNSFNINNLSLGPRVDMIIDELTELQSSDADVEISIG